MSVTTLSKGFFHRAFERNITAHQEHPIIQINNLKPMGATQRMHGSACDGEIQYKTVCLDSTIPEEARQPNIILRVIGWDLKDLTNRTDGIKRKALWCTDVQLLSDHKTHNCNCTIFEFDMQIRTLVSCNIGTSNASQSIRALPLYPGDSIETRKRKAPDELLEQRIRIVTGEEPAPNDRIYPIKALTPYQNKWLIRSKVTAKSDLRNWSSGKGQGKLFSVDLADEDAEIRATAFNDTAEKLYDKLELGCVYFISGGAIKQANRRYTSIKNEYELTFSNTTFIKECADETASIIIPEHHYDFKPFDILKQINDSVIDVCGVVKSVGDVEQIVTRKDSKELKKRDVILVDDTNHEIMLTLFGDKAESFALPMLDENTQMDNPILAVKNAQVKEFRGGVGLMCNFSTILTFNPDLPQANRIINWWLREGQNNETVKISTVANLDTVNSNLISPIGLCRLREEQLGPKPIYFSVIGTITRLNVDSILYPACANTPDGSERKCLKKLHVIKPNVSWRCERCDLTMDHFEWRALLSFEINDYSGFHWVTAFNEQVETMVDRTIANLGLLKETDAVEYEKIWDRLFFNRFLFRIRAREEIFRDEKRVKWNVINVAPFDPTKYYQHIDALVNKLKLSLE